MGAIVFWVKILQKVTSFLKKAMIITVTNYNFKKTSENVSLEQSKLFKDSHHPSYIKKMKIYVPGTILNGLRILTTPATSRKWKKKNIGRHY